jgi:RHS repeat-associated protein
LDVTSITRKPLLLDLHSHSPLDSCPQFSVPEFPTACSQGCSWDYDRYGNRWHQNPYSGSCPAPSFGFIGNNNRIDNASYDALGNLLSDGSHHYLYDVENRLVSMDTGATTYTYDGDGKRVEKNMGGALVDYVYEHSGQVLWDTAGTVLEHLNYYAAGGHVATALTNANNNGANVYFHHNDWLGTERVRTDITGAVCENIASLPFGDNQTITGTCGDISPMHFTGKERDTESGLDEFGARYYASSLGRFMTPDWATKPIDVPGLAHLYVFL